MKHEYMDPDELTYLLTRSANASRRAKKAGVCTHGWLDGSINRPHVTCNDCGQEFPGMTLDQVIELGREIRSEYL